MKHLDITGNKYGFLTAIKRVNNYISPKGYVKQQWLFRCDCGNYIIRCKSLVIKGECCSCGCEKKRRIIEYNKKNKIKHNKLGTRIYRIWSGIKTRCLNKNDNSYKYYGERGIKICEEWKNSFEIFYNWAISNGYKEDLTIDRINNNGNYCPENCRWITMKEQNRNKRNNLIIELDGEAKTLAEWGEMYGFDTKAEIYKIKKDKEYLRCLILKKTN